VGAYQEILGDLHNLFGDTNAIHVSLVDDRYRIEHVQVGDTISEVLGYVQFGRKELLDKVRSACEDALLGKRMTTRETALLLRRYEDGLNAYTYLTDTPPVTTAAPPGATPEEPAQAAESTPRSGS